MVTTYYNITAENGPEISFAVAADLHNAEYDEVITRIKREKIDFIAIPGDLISKKQGCERGYAFLREAAQLKPTFYEPGNHEKALDSDGLFDRSVVKESGVVLLENASIRFGDINIGGLSMQEPTDTEWLTKFAEKKGYKLLMCHRPEYYFQYISKLNIDITVAGHAHGGQIRLFGRGLFSPGQGLFPKYTSGVYDGRLIVSRGLTNTVVVPRINNEPELLVVSIHRLDKRLPSISSTSI
ncbi:MAG: metallophosphoesterase [Oscillospiraceae bacterium]|nr:metallophosphoesterase [Oscillospiraceae bacterium]